MESSAEPSANLKPHIAAIGVTALCAIACGATFLFALFRQFGLVEVAASLATGLEVFFLSASIGDLLEDSPQPNRTRFLCALILAAAVVACFGIRRIAGA